MFCRWSLFNLQELVCALKLYNTQKNGKEKINHVYIFDLNKDKSIAFVNILTYFLFYQYFFYFADNIDSFRSHSLVDLTQLPLLFPVFHHCPFSSVNDL